MTRTQLLRWSVKAAATKQFPPIYSKSMPDWIVDWHTSADNEFVGQPISPFRHSCILSFQLQQVDSHDSTGDSRISQPMVLIQYIREACTSLMLFRVSLDWEKRGETAVIVASYSGISLRSPVISVSRHGLLPVVIVCTNLKIQARENAVCRD